MSLLSFEHRSSGSVVSTINFQTAGWALDYIPTTSGKETVTEKFRAWMDLASTSALKTKINAIETMLDFARSHPTGAEGIWILYSPDSGTSYQSRLVDGLIITFDKRTQYKYTLGEKLIEIAIERNDYWEAQTAVTLKLTNGAVTAQDAAPIANIQDATRELYVEIPAAQVTGVLPTPAILEFTNTQNDATILDDLLVGVLQGNGASTEPAPATLSNAGSGVLSWVDDDENQLQAWTIAGGGFLQKRYRAVARLAASVIYTDLFLKAKLLIGTIVIAETRWVQVEAGHELVVIGSMNIPPYALGQLINIGNVTLGLYEKHATGTGEINLNYILLMPQDSWRAYAGIPGLAYNEKLIDDPVRDVLITGAGASFKVTHKVVEGDPLMLRPGVKNYLYFLQNDTDDNAPNARTASVTVKIHPRRLTV